MLKYLLMVRLRESLPVLYRDPQGPYYHLFIEGKVYLVYEDILMEPDIFYDTKWPQLKNLWILADSTHFENNGEIPRYLSTGRLISKLIFTTSPQQDRWVAGRQRDFHPHVLFMNPYSEAEAQFLYVTPTSM